MPDKTPFVIDFHAHFPYWGKMGEFAWKDRYIATYGQEKWDLLNRRREAAAQKRWDAWNMTPPESTDRTIDEMAQIWADEIDKNPLERIVFLTGGGNDTLSSVVRKYPNRFIGFAHHDIFAPDAAAELERAVTELGLKGLFSPRLEKPISDQSLYPLWEKAEELKIPVLIHFGIGPQAGETVPAWHINPLDLKEVAKSFPYLQFVVPHFGAGYMRELLLLCWSCQNINVDTSGSNEWMAWMPHEVTLSSAVKKFYETVGPDRILFGTDSSFLPRGWVTRYFENLYQVCCDLGLDDASIAKIFGRNAARLLKLDTERLTEEAPVAVR